jgi:hypothetical protein
MALPAALLPAAASAETAAILPVARASSVFATHALPTVTASSAIARIPTNPSSPETKPFGVITPVNEVLLMSGHVRQFF